MSPLHLTLTDYHGPTRWRWVLADSAGRFLADHDVRLDPDSREYRGFCDLHDYTNYYAPIRTVEDQLAALGIWVGEQVFGNLRDALRRACRPPATPVLMTVPRTARELLLRPFELARFADGTPFDRAGVRFVYHLEEAPARSCPPVRDVLRVLAVFSLPARTDPINLRRERYGLQRLVRELSQTRGRAVHLRFLQYGATRQTLREALEEAPGWDIVHISGHGEQGILILEDEYGQPDPVDADALSALLEPTAGRLKLLILDACYSGAGSHAAARAQLGLDPGPARREGAPSPETAPTVLPGLAQDLSARLACAALAMRYPVEDGFATDLMLALYDKLLDKNRSLPDALHLALEETLRAAPRPPLSPYTPILVGAPAADLTLAPPPGPPPRVALPQVGLSIAFPPEPERFVGRVLPMLRAGQALAPRSERRGVLFYGMPGGGKTTCALELAYRHAEGRFAGYVWYRAPDEGTDISGELFRFLFEVERQLNAPDLGLTAALDNPPRFRKFTLPRLRALLREHSILLVLDNLETLLTESGDWRDPLWGDVLEATLSHEGFSRVVLTSRRLPASLKGHPRLHAEPVHALSLAESVLLARELPNLRRLFDDGEGLALLRAVLRVAQGHPKLLELADRLAGDRAALRARVEALEAVADAGVLDAFFAFGEREGESRQEEADFLRALSAWTLGLLATLPPDARLLLEFLCRLEPEDRQAAVVEANWGDFLARLGRPEAPWAPALDALQALGLVEVERPSLPGPDLLAQLAGQAGLPPEALEALLAQLRAAATFTIHPGIAEAVRAGADPAVLDAADLEVGNFHGAMFAFALQRETEGLSQAVAASARRAVPYLMRQKRWREAAMLLEWMLARDDSPAALAFALPVLRRIAEATKGTERELIDTGILARALWQAGRTDEAEAMLRDLVARAAAQGQYHLASTAAGELFYLLLLGGRPAEALRVVEEKAEYTRRAGLGPWSQLANEGYRLQALAAMGRYEEVLERVEALRPRLAALPLETGAEEAVVPWGVREGLLDAGREAALQSGRWTQALALNAEILRYEEERGAGPLERARARFNDYGPLLALGRYEEARRLLRECRAVFEAEGAVPELGAVYGALADLEDETGDRDAAVRFQRIALGYSYRAGLPEDCAIGHHNLANYLERQGADPALVLAHRLAAAVIRLQTQSGLLPTTIRNLALSALPPAPPSFAEVAARVEEIEGVRFRALFERLPRRYPDGDAAIAEVWKLAAEERARLDRARTALGSLLPPEVAAALESGEPERAMVALAQALERMSPEEQRALAARIQEVAQEAGIPVLQWAGPDMAEVLREFEPLLGAIAAAAKDPRLRAELEPVLERLEENGWMLRGPVHRIWAGERDADVLTAGIDPNSAQLVRRILELVG